MSGTSLSRHPKAYRFAMNLCIIASNKSKQSLHSRLIYGKPVETSEPYSRNYMSDIFIEWYYYKHGICRMQENIIQKVLNIRK